MKRAAVIILAALSVLVCSADTNELERLRVEFGAGIEEWPEQLRALKDVAKALSLCHAQLRPEDDLSFLSTSHELSGDKLLEFECFIKRHAAAKDSLGDVRDVGGLIRLLAQLGY